MSPARIRNHITNLFKKIPYDKNLSKIFLTLARLGVGEVSYALSDSDSIRTKAIWESAEELGVKLFTYKISKDLPYGITVAKYANETLIYQDVPRPKGWNSPSLEWMDDKNILKKKLIKAGLPTAKGGIVFTEQRALSLFSQLASPVIIKPHLGTRGRHTTLSLVTQEDVLRAFAIGKEIAVGLVLEEELQGDLYRVTLVGGEPVAVARRDFPHVIGDGVSTIADLITITNSDKRRDGFSFYPILDNDRMAHQLNLQKLTKSSIPENGRLVVLNDKVSRLHGTTTVDVTETVHPDCMELFRKIGAFLGDAVVGVDFIIGDITRSPIDQNRYGVVECNAMPYIDLHHYPFEGKPRPVAQELWKLCFPKINKTS
jgi:cyanophycin synthetase